MTNFPAVLLDHFRCSQCYCVLSVGPVRCGPEGAPVCGRCPPSPKDVLNPPLQALLTRYEFPCRYIANGCNKALPFGDADHEQECQFKEVAASDEAFETIDASIMEDLKCTSCKKYLSVGPLSLTAEGDSVCGRCAHHWSELYGEDTLVRNWKLEFVMQKLPLQCSYHDLGCRRALKWGEVQRHEEFCPTRSYNCPATPLDSCQAVLRAADILQHFEQEHPTLVLTTPKFQQDLTRDSYTHRLLKLNKQLYLVMSKIRVEENRLWMSVCYIGDVNVAKLLKYTFKFTNSDETNHLTSNEELVQCDLSLRLNEPTAIPMTLDGLRIFLRQPNLDATMCIVTVNGGGGEVSTPPPSEATLKTCKWQQCQLIGAHKRILAHEQVCAEREAQCACGAEMPHRFLSAHEDACAEILVECRMPYCYREMSRREMPNHESRCDFRVIGCKWPNCEQRLGANRMQKHERDCSKRIVTCRFADCRVECSCNAWNCHVTECEHQYDDTYYCYTADCKERLSPRALSLHVLGSHPAHVVQGPTLTTRTHIRGLGWHFMFVQFDGRLFRVSCEFESSGCAQFHLDLCDTADFRTDYKFTLKVFHPSKKHKAIVRHEQFTWMTISADDLAPFVADDRVKFQLMIIMK